MSDPRWYRSLYWRIGLGLFAFLALMLAAQGALFLWMTDSIAGSMPASNPQRLADLVASDISAALEESPLLNLDTYVSTQFGKVFQTFLVLMQDGRIVSNQENIPADVRDAVTAEARMRQQRFAGRGRRGGPPPPGEGFPPRGFGGPRGSGRGGPPPRSIGDFAPIIVNGNLVGSVAVLPGGPPISRIARELGPTMGLVGGGVLAVGIGLIAFVVFGPVRRRLRQVQDATERLGGGDLEARVPDRGGDEVAAVARSFNRMAEELTARAHALAASDKVRRQLLADVSHELMTPLTAMRGYIETLTMPEVRIDEQTRQRYLDIVTEETHRLERIVGDLLDLARLEGGGITTRQSRVDVAALFARVSKRHERELEARGITLAQDIGVIAETVTGDPDRLEQAIQNLAANALRHTPDGGTVSLSSHRAGTAVRLVVRDSGPGIPLEHLPRIFERFYKADSSRRAAGGSGLGLSIVKAIVERHGGTITARNDGGAVFDIELPVAGTST